LFELCRTRADYFQAWERGQGPGQNAATPGEAPATVFPPLHRQAWNLARALADFVADGMKTVSEEEYQARLEICDGCDQRRGNRCLKCGCRLTLKARGRAFRCPLDKWPVSST
jgi:hypothetical protein